MRLPAHLFLSEPDLMTSCPLLGHKVSRGGRVAILSLGSLSLSNPCPASSQCPLEVYSHINRSPMPGLEPATINRHEVNKVADAGAWDETENLPLYAWAGAKAHPWKGISSLPLLPSPPQPAGFWLPMLWASNIFPLGIILQGLSFAAGLPWSPALFLPSQDGMG